MDTYKFTGRSVATGEVTDVTYQQIVTDIRYNPRVDVMPAANSYDYGGLMAGTGAALLGGAGGSGLAIPANFNEGSSIPNEVKAQLRRASEAWNRRNPRGMEPALTAARLHHATPQQVIDLAKKFRFPADEVRAFVRGTNILVPSGQGLTLRDIAHEVWHVGDFLILGSRFDERYEVAYQRSLAQLLSLPTGDQPSDLYDTAYRNNPYERHATQFAEEVIKVDSP